MESKSCASCGQRGSDCRLKKCTACKSVWYCNVTCQKAHRKAHRKECKRIEEERKKADAVAAVAGGNVLNSNQEKGAATKLICAPCWICLEEGPDEAGEPLVRNCSCRGETSAGYHISCLINYAKSKTQRLIERSIELNDFNSMKSTWLLCPNCSGPYFVSDFISDTAYGGNGDPKKRPHTAYTERTPAVHRAYVHVA